MKYFEFADLTATVRMERYLMACSGDTSKAMVLYRRNLKLSQELFTVISCFEVALRNAIDKHYVNVFGNDWIKHASSCGGIFDNQRCILTKTTISDAVQKLNSAYTHHKLVAELGFGFWRYMFAPQQFRICGSTLLQILPAKPRSTPSVHYNHTFIFNQLAAINQLRNRIAHHEPICFLPGLAVKNTSYARQHYQLILTIFQWMSINNNTFLYGLDHIMAVCNEIDNLA